MNQRRHTLSKDIERWPSPLYVYLTTCPSNLQQGLISPNLENIKVYQSRRIRTCSSLDRSHEDQDRAQPINLGTIGLGQNVTSCADGTLKRPSQMWLIWDDGPPLLLILPITPKMAARFCA